MNNNDLTPDLVAILNYIKKNHNEALGYSNIGISDIRNALMLTKRGSYKPIKTRVEKLIELGYISKVNSGKGKFLANELVN